MPDVSAVSPLDCDEALATIDRVSIECYTSFGALPRAELLDTDEVFGVLTEVPVNFFSGIARTRLREDDIDGGVGRTVDVFKKMQRPFRWWITPSTRPANLASALQRHRFNHTYDATGMVADIDDVPFGALGPREIRIEHVSRLDELRQWAEVLLGVFARPPNEIPAWIEAYTHLGLDRPSAWAHFIGYSGEKPLATSSVLCRDGIAGVYHVSTVAEARGRGVGAAMTLEALTYAAENGATRAALQSSEMGVGVYRSLGFRQVCPLTLYDWKPEN